MVTHLKAVKIGINFNTKSKLNFGNRKGHRGSQRMGLSRGFYFAHRNIMALRWVVKNEVSYKDR